jgi:NADH:ubiquinone oxidoreductase subunit E
MAAKYSLQICMGSACHQQGVYEVLPYLQEMVAQYHLENILELKGAFCLGVCARGVVLKLGDNLILDVNEENVRQKFMTEVLTKLEGVTSQ